MSIRQHSLWGGLVTVLIVSLPTAFSQPSLEVRLTSDPYVPAGQPVTCELWMRDFSCAPAAPRAVGYQAFLAFPADRLAFVSGTYTNDPFATHLLPVADLGGVFDLAAGIDPLAGQTPVCGNHLLVSLTFVALVPGEGCTLLHFRHHAPPTLVADTDGNPIDPLLLWASPPFVSPADFDYDCDVDLADFAVFRSCMAGPDVTLPPPGCDPQDFAQADLDHDADVDLADFALFQRAFTG